MKVKCMPTKELFKDFISGYRIISCNPIGLYPELKLNKYNNFSISGNNLDSLRLYQEANIVIEPDESSRYPASYLLTGYEGVEAVDGKIEVNPEYEYEILCRLMAPDQAKRVNDAYPRFVNMVLNGQESEIDSKNIYNVGKVRLPEYIEKVKNDCKSIIFYPIAFDAGIKSSEDIREIRSNFKTPEEFKKALEVNPYRIYIDLIHYPFEKADRKVLEKHPELIDSKIRCEYGCLEILRLNELDGDTRINANLMASELKRLVPEARHHVVEAVKESNLIHYDEETKYASIEATYQDELTIAENILQRKNNPIANFIPMDWEKYREVDGFSCTDEQVQILKYIANGERVAILTGGAGVGKTSSIKALIKMLEGNGKGYTLLAPTGIAAKRMRESTGRSANTIHMFLAHDDMYAEEYVVIDEMSMVSVNLLAKLFLQIGDKPNIIFVCDEAQLASISCGNIVQDLISSQIIPHANLTKVFRYGTQGLATVATDTRMGTMKNLHGNFEDLKYVPINSDPIGQVLKEYEVLVNKGYSKDDILVLSPFNKGAKGTYEINNAIQSRFNPNDYSFVSYERKSLGKIRFKLGDKILNTKNNYQMPCLDSDDMDSEAMATMQCMNGDIGTIREFRGDENDPVIIAEFDNGLAYISGSDIGNLLLGYSVSVHKVQGAQSKAIIVVIDKEHSRLLTRNLLYVGFSRAQKDMVIIADENVLNEALTVQENMERDTWLCDMLKGAK